jgi:hypothetical protein
MVFLLMSGYVGVCMVSAYKTQMVKLNRSAEKVQETDNTYRITILAFVTRDYNIQFTFFQKVGYFCPPLI